MRLLSIRRARRLFLSDATTCEASMRLSVRSSAAWELGEEDWTRVDDWMSWAGASEMRASKYSWTIVLI